MSLDLIHRCKLEIGILKSYEFIAGWNLLKSKSTVQEFHSSKTNVSLITKLPRLRQRKYLLYIPIETFSLLNKWFRAWKLNIFNVNVVWKWDKITYCLITGRLGRLWNFFQNEFTLGTLDPFWSANLPRFALEVYRPKRVLGTLGKFILKKIP